MLYNSRRKAAIPYHKQLLDTCKENPYFDAYELDWQRLSIRTFFFKALHKIMRAIHLRVRLRSPYLLMLANDYPVIPQYLQAKNIKAQVYLGHRPASLPIIYYLSRRHQAISWFDIEDQHLSESTDPLVNRMMRDFVVRFPCDRFTTASRLIGKEFLQQAGWNAEAVEILNSPIVEDVKTKNQAGDKPVFVWFSQTITFHRGLELFFEALSQTGLSARLHLIGELDPAFKAYVDDLELPDVVITYYGFIPEQEVNHLVASSDIGLALELPTVDRSRQLAITNKILTYAVLGCYILATDTDGQQDIVARLHQNATLIPASVSGIVQFFKKMDNDLSRLRAGQAIRQQQARVLAWSEQEKQLVRFIESLSICRLS